MAEDSALKKARDKLTGAIKGKIPDATAIISGMASGNPAVMLGTKHILDSLSKLTKKVTDSENKKTAEDSDKKGNGILSPQFETKLFTLLSSMRDILFAGLSPKAGRGRLAQIEKDQEFKQFLDKFLDIQEDKAGAGVTIDGKKQSRGIMGLLSGIFGFGTLGAGKGILARVFGALVPMKAPQLIKGLVKRTPILGLAAGLIWMATDAIVGVGKADLWNVSKVNAGVSAAIGGTDKGLKGAFKNAGKWALIGAGVGSFVPVVGTIAGGLIGAAIGGILGWIGGERISGFLSKVGDFFTMEKMAEVGKSLAIMMTKIGKWIGEGLTTLWFGTKDSTGKYVGGILGWLNKNIFDSDKLFEHIDAMGTFATKVADAIVKGIGGFVAGLMEGFEADQRDVDSLKSSLEHLDVKSFVEDMAKTTVEWFFKQRSHIDDLLGTDKAAQRISSLVRMIKAGTATHADASELIYSINWRKDEAIRQGRERTGIQEEWDRYYKNYAQFHQYRLQGTTAGRDLPPQEPMLPEWTTKIPAISTGVDILLNPGGFALRNYLLRPNPNEVGFNLAGGLLQSMITGDPMYTSPHIRKLDTPGVDPSEVIANNALVAAGAGAYNMWSLLRPPESTPQRQQTSQNDQGPAPIIITPTETHNPEPTLQEMQAGTHPRRGH